MIKVKGLYKRFGKLEVLKGLDLEVNAGETLVILGRSGVGKSVLLKQIIGLDRPDQGTVEIDGQELYKLSAKERNAKIMGMGMLFQGSALFDSMTVGENTAFYLRQHPNPETGKPYKESEIQHKVKEALTMVDLPDTQNKMPSDLSGGMRKRAALARLIVYRPRLLLYDEPTTGLDPLTSMQINDLIRKTQKELQGTSIVVTHDIRSAVEIGDRLAFHNDGKIAYIAPKKEFFHIDDPTLQAFFSNAILTPSLIDGENKRTNRLYES